MAKLTMKDYEDFLEEEARQDRLQEELESKRDLETRASEDNWYEYLAEQEEERRWLKKFYGPSKEDGYFDEDDFDDDYEPEGEYDPDCYLDPDPLHGSEDDELFDTWYDHIYDYGSQKYDCFDKQDLLDVDVPCKSDDFLTAEYMYDMYTYACEEDSCYCEDRICGKSVSRNRHHASERSKKRSKVVSDIIQKQHMVSKKKNRKKRKREKKLLGKVA